MNEVKFKYLNKLIFNQNSTIRDIIKIFNGSKWRTSDLHEEVSTTFQLSYQMTILNTAIVKPAKFTEVIIRRLEVKLPKTLISNILYFGSIIYK